MNIKLRNQFVGDIPANQIEKAYRKAFKVPYPDRLQRLVMRFVGIRIGNPLCLPFLFADEYYEEASPNTINQVLLEDKPNLTNWHYVEEHFDCDNFAFRLMGILNNDHRTAGMPFFITWVETPEGGHAVLSYYYKGEVTIIEPQNYETYSVPKTYKLLVLIG